MTLAEVLRLVVSSLDRLGIPYMVAGSFASAAHGVPRSSMDADVIVDINLLKGQALAQAFQGDFYVDAGQISQAISSTTSFNVVHLGSMYKVDLFVLGKSNFAREEFSRRIAKSFPDAPDQRAYIATAEDTILSKLDWYQQGGCISDQQWRDVLGILKIQAGVLDLAYLRKWAEELAVGDLLAKAFSDAGTAK
jgi:hypothetical protein